MQKGIRLQFFTVRCVWKIACTHQVRSGTRCEEPTVTRNGMSALENNEAMVKSRKSRLELSGYVPTDCELAESFGGGSEYLPFLRPPLWPFSWIRLFRQEEE
jgi:hypothetical protein